MHQKLCCTQHRGAQKLTEDNQIVVWVEFSTLSQAVFIMSVIAWQM